MIVNEQTTTPDINTESSDVTTNTAVVENDSQNQTNPTVPPIVVDKVVNYFKSKLDKAGKKYDEKLLYQYAKRSDLKTFIRKWHVYNGFANQLPSPSEVDSVYNTWIDQNAIEKKNQNQTAQQVLQSQPNVQSTDSDSPSTSTDGSSSSAPNTINLSEEDLNNASNTNTDEINLYDFDSWKKEIEIKGIGGYLSETRYLSTIVNQIPKEVFEMNERDAERELKKLLTPYQYEVSQDVGTSNQLKIKTPDGREQIIELYPNLKKQRLNYINDGGVEDLVDNRFKQFKNFLLGYDDDGNVVGNPNLVQNMADRFSNSNNIIIDIFQETERFVTPELVDLENLAGSLGVSVDTFMKDGLIDSRSVELGIISAKASLQQVYDDAIAQEQNIFNIASQNVRSKFKNVYRASGEAVTTEIKKETASLFESYDPDNNIFAVKQAYKYLDDMLVAIKEKKDIASKFMGSALALSGTYKGFDLNDSVGMMYAVRAGLDLGDMPSDGILINGLPSSANSFQNIVTDPQGLHDIMKGKIKIEVDPNSDAYGVLAPYISGALKLQDRNEAYDSTGGLKGTAGQALANANIAYEWVEDLVQGVGIGVLDIGANTGVLFSDALQMIGFDKTTADSVVFGMYGLPTTPGLISPQEVLMLKESALPLYDKQIKDADSFGEMLALVNQPFSQSIPYFAAFAVNPALGLTVTGTSSYGASKTEFDRLKMAAQDALDRGAELTESQKKILSVGEWEARGIAFSKAAQETIMTRLFTYRYFKSMSGAKNFSGAKNLENARKLAESFEKVAVKSRMDGFKKMFGVDGKALRNEIIEEEIIALNNYTINVMWGLEEYDQKKLNDLMVNTGLISVFSSTAMQKFATFGMNKKIRGVVDSTIKGNIKLDSERQVVENYLKADVDVAVIEQDAEKNGTPLEGNDSYNSALRMRSKYQEELMDIENAKQELVDNMSESDKAAYLELIIRLEESHKILNSDKTNTEKQVALDNIPKLQESLRSILARNPSELGFHLLNSKTQQEYFDKAMNMIVNEEKDKAVQEGKGDDFSIDLSSTDPMVIQRAAEMYKNELETGLRNNRESFLPASSYNVLDPTKYMVDVTREEMDNFNIQASIESFRLKQYNAKTLDEKGGKKPDNQRENLEQPKVELTTEGIERPVTKEDVLLQQKIDEQQEKKDNLKEDSGKKQTLGEYKTESIDDIVNIIESFAINEDFMASLPEYQQKHIVKFFSDIELGKDPQLGHVRSILDSHRIATDISGRSADKIEIFQALGFKKDEIANLTVEQMYAKLNSLSQKFVTAGFNVGSFKTGFGTGDIILKTLFRDKYVGSKFYDLFRRVSRKVDESRQTTNLQYKEALSLYEKLVIKQNSETGGNKSVNPNDLENSYTLYMLAGGFRKSGKTNEKGVDLEFSRFKSLLSQELRLRKQEFDSSSGTNKAKYKKEYEMFKRVYDALGYETANSYSELNASEADINFIKRVSLLQPGDLALRRITDFGGKLDNQDRGTSVPFVDGSYIPIPLFKGFDSSGSRTSSKDGGEGSNINDASNLMSIEFVENLSEDLRLNPGMFAKNVFDKMNGALTDINARQDVVTLKYLMDNPRFQELFSSKKEYDVLAAYFKGREKIFNNIVAQGNNNVVEVSSGAKYIIPKVIRAAYSTWAARALARLDQRPSQFYSAISGTAPYLKSKFAKNHLNSGTFKFTGGLSTLTNGTKARTIVGKYMQNSMFGRGDLSNIYSKSRTGLRNAIQAEFLLDENQQIPTSYYLNFLNIKDKDGAIIKEVGAVSTLNNFIDYISKGSELSLDIFLASADRAAANVAFESHYIDARVKQGENLENVDMTAWWKKENENPNTDAINEADALVAQTMRQTGKFSEADIYNNGETGQNILRAFIPFQRFITNARANFANQVAILNDPTIPPSQKSEAKSAIQGIIQEIMTFKSVKLGSALVTMKGFAAGILGFGLSDDDIRRRGGVTQLIGADMLPVEDRPGLLESGPNEYSDLFGDLPPGQKETLEADFISKMASREYASIEGFSYYIGEYAREYENKFKVGNTYSVLSAAIGDVLLTTKPFALPSAGESALLVKLNEMMGNEFFNDFVSKDIENAKTKGGRRELILENFSGVYGIGEEQYNKVVEALDLYFENEVNIYTGEYGNRTQYVGGGNNEARTKQLRSSIGFLVSLRTLGENFLPGVPKGDLIKIGNYLQRAIENEFKTTKKDPLMPTIDRGSDSGLINDAYQLLKGPRQNNEEEIKKYLKQFQR